MSSKKLSERLETLNLDGTTVGWEDCQHCESIIEAVRELEVANEQLQDAYSKDHLTWKKDAEKLYARLGQDRESLTYEIKLCMDERDAAIRERDEARAQAVENGKAFCRMRTERDEAVDQMEHTFTNEDFQNEVVFVAEQRDAAIRERDEARAERTRLISERETELALALDETRDERDTALAKLAAVREWALGVVYPLLGTAQVDFDYGYSDAQRDLLAILDRQKECNTNNHCWCQMLDGHVECSKCGQKESGTAPVAADTETVTREVVLWKDYAEQLQCHESKAFDLFQPSLKARELARATVTFDVPKPKVEKKCACGARHWSEGEGIGLMELCTCKQSKTELETLAAEIRHGREVADAREVYLQKKCAHKYGFRYSGASGGCDPWSVYKCIMCNFETVSPGNLDKDWEKRVKKAP